MGIHQRIAIIGGGPAGNLTAALLASAGRSVVVFDLDKRPELIVGESMLPAVVPLLRRIGVEAEVRACSVHKPGASLTSEDRIYPFAFEAAMGEAPSYSYNVDRRDFDRILRSAARRHGATHVDLKATMADDGRGGVELTGECNDVAREILDGPPDVIVDASGRHALIERTLGLKSSLGSRNDVALFAHLDSATLEHEGHIHVDRLQHGWSWRIPLRDRTSVGLVVSRDHLARYGDTAAEQYDSMLDAFPRLAARVSGSRRLSSVLKYTNYQRHATRLHGPNWVLVGDAAGFVDPVFSTGVYLALHGATLVADALIDGAPARLVEYERAWLPELRRWRRIISHWYDGRLLALLRVGGVMSRAPGGSHVDRHVAKHVTRIFTGEAGAASYSRRLLNVLLPLGRPSQARHAIH